MNIHKNEKSGKRCLLTSQTERALRVGMVLILTVLVYLCFTVTDAAPYSAATAEDFGRWLEYPAAALTLLTALCFLLDRVVRAEKNN